MKSNSGQISITRSHIGAVLTTAIGLAAIAFFVGLDVGRNQANPGEAPRLTLLPDAASDDALEALLREVEAAQHSASARAADVVAAPQTDGFREVLADARADPTLDAAPVPTDAPTDPVALDAPVTAIPAPEPPAIEANVVRPMDGWSVQIASYHTPEEADTKVSELQAAGYSAYEVTALVKGVTWYRVRISGYDSQEGASEGIASLETALGTHGLVVAKAP